MHGKIFNILKKAEYDCSSLTRKRCYENCSVQKYKEGTPERIISEKEARIKNRFYALLQLEIIKNINLPEDSDEKIPLNTLNILKDMQSKAIKLEEMIKKETTEEDGLNIELQGKINNLIHPTGKTVNRIKKMLMDVLYGNDFPDDIALFIVF